MKTVSWLIIIMIWLAIMYLFCGCMSAPEKKNYQNQECFVAQDCLYRVKSGKDKAVCSPLVEACRDAMKEKRYINRVEYCRDKTPAGMSENECRLYLNQK